MRLIRRHTGIACFWLCSGRRRRDVFPSRCRDPFCSCCVFFVFRGAVYSFPGFFAAIHFRMDFFCFFHAVYLSSPFLRRMCQKEAKFLEISGNLAYHDNVTGRCSSCGLFSTGRAIINQTLRKRRPVRFLFRYRRNGPVFYHPVRDV